MWDVFLIRVAICQDNLHSKRESAGAIMKHLFKVAAFVLLGLLAACGPSSFNNKYAGGYYASDVSQCVPYARQVSGIALRGDAYSWWFNAQGKYRRGNFPVPGAVLVLKRTSRLPHGHVAVVKTFISPRVINVTHCNWGSNYDTRRVVYDYMRAEDVSARNDWTQVRFWNNNAGKLGAPYPAYGFIYP